MKKIHFIYKGKLAKSNSILNNLRKLFARKIIVNRIN